MEINKDAYESGEYVTFHVTARDGRDVEMAVVDEFDIENRHYVVSSGQPRIYETLRNYVRSGGRRTFCPILSK